jgi:hypothetical protein
VTTQISMNRTSPYIINFPKIGESALGFISIAEKENLPFVPKRIYWTYFTPEEVKRGAHAHFELEQILIAVAGKITLTTELINGETTEHVLDSPDKGLYIPKMCWRTMKYSHNAVQISIASHEFEESDYIREYKEFEKLKTR